MRFEIKNPEDEVVYVELYQNKEDGSIDIIGRKNGMDWLIASLIDDVFQPNGSGCKGLGLEIDKRFMED